MAGRFSRRVRAYAKEHRIPVIDRRVNQRTNELAEQHLETTTVTEGVFLILVGRAQAPGWEVRGKPTTLDRHYEALRTGMHGIFHELGIAA